MTDRPQDLPSPPEPDPSPTADAPQAAEQMAHRLVQDVAAAEVDPPPPPR